MFIDFLVACFFAGGLESSEESPLSESLESSLLPSFDEDESSESSLSELLEELLWLATCNASARGEWEVWPCVVLNAYLLTGRRFILL